MAKRASRYEAMRMDPANWKLGVVYYCSQDPRVVVRNRNSLGWAWNFGCPIVFVAITWAILAFLGPAFVLWLVGVRSPIALFGVAVVSLALVVMVARRLARDPKN